MNLYDKRIVMSIIVCAFTLLIYAFGSSIATGRSTEYLSTDLIGKTASTLTASSGTIPEIVHFIIGASSDTAPIQLNFLAFLSIYSAGLYMPHAEIWLHTNASQTMINAALKTNGISPPTYSQATSEGESGVEILDAEYSEYWTQAVVQGVKNLKIKPITSSHTMTKTGKPITKWANWADFVRADVIYEHGGVFLDLDAVILRDLTPLLRSGFRNILARDGETQCGVLMAARKTNMMRAYRELMDGAFDPNLYAYHATSLLHALREVFVRIPSEVLMLSDRSFYPITWDMYRDGTANVEQLFSIHNQDMTEAAHDIGDMAAFDYESWISSYSSPRPSEFSYEGPTGLDLSETYILHVYHSQFRSEVKTGRIKDMTKSKPSKLAHGLTLPLVLEGNSHFSRAVLKIVWHAMKQGVISVQ